MATDQSILKSVKKLLGLGTDYTLFDNDIILHINSVLSNLVQMGVGTEGFVVEDESETWSDFLGGSTTNLEQIRSYVYIKVKLLFDPPSNSTILQSLTESAKEMEWRLYIQKQGGNY